MAEQTLKYKVALIRSDGVVSVSVPGLPGCFSQGGTEEEALENIAIAIREYREVAAGLAESAEAREVEVILSQCRASPASTTSTRSWPWRGSGFASSGRESTSS